MERKLEILINFRYKQKSDALLESYEEAFDAPASLTSTSKASSTSCCYFQHNISNNSSIAMQKHHRQLKEAAILLKVVLMILVMIQPDLGVVGQIL